MDLQHSFVVPVPPDVAWRTLNDVERIAPCFPGAALTSNEGEEFTGTVKVKLGPVSMQYSGKGRFLERDEAAGRARIEASGKDKRGNGTASATVTATLVPEGDSSTRVVVDTDLKVTGRPAQFGRGVVSDVGGKLLDAFAACLAETIGAGGGSADGGSTPEAGEATLGAGEVDVQGEQVEDDRDTLGAPVGAPIGSVDAGPSSGGSAGAAPSGGRPAEGETVPAPFTAPTSPATTSPAVTVTPATPAPAPVPSVTHPTPLAPSPRGGSATNELDLGLVVGPVLLRKYGPTLLACLVTGVVAWVVARRTR